MRLIWKGAGPLKKAFILLIHLMLLTYVAMILYPLFNMIMSSFKTTREILTTPFSLPTSFSIANYVTVWVERGFARYFFNSFWITGISIFFVVLLGSMAAYGISRFKFRGSIVIYMLFLSGIMLPLRAAVISLFQIIQTLGLFDTPLALIFIFVAMGLPSTVFILAGFMKTIPDSLLQAAQIDGCSQLRMYGQIVMPITMPSVALVTIYNAVPIWNDFFFPLVFIRSASIRPLPLGLNQFIGQFGTRWDLMFTGLSVAIIPVLILYLVMSKYFIKGMTSGALK